ncbi:hypothetical protein Peur_024952 [Populus x canadensis]
MEEIRRAAVAYYEHLSENNKKLARKTFKSMDKNGDGKISLLEYVDYLKKNKATDFIHPGIFTAVDKDGNGSLDFEEAIVLFYIMQSGRAISCQSCEKFLAGAYFSCSQCFFNDSVSTYEICCECYGRKNFTHHDGAIFCDNYTLLLQSRSVIQEAPIKYFVNGYVFHTKEYGHGRNTYNIGVCIKGSTSSEFEVDYYGKLEELNAILSSSGLENVDEEDDNHIEECNEADNNFVEDEEENSDYI